MSKAHSTQSQVPSKPERPEGSPLFWHASGRWCKKINGKQHYFGRGTHAEALELYEQKKDDLLSGKRPADTCLTPAGPTVYKLGHDFLKEKKDKRNAGELSPHTYDDYAAVCKLLHKTFGKDRLVSDLRPEDFAKLRKRMSKTWGPVRIGNVVQRVRTVFKYGAKSGWIVEPLYGPAFAPPSARAMREERFKQGPKFFTADEVRKLIDGASVHLKAMILLGINAGYGNSDCATLPLSALDLDSGIVSYPRPKTAIPRRCILWPETVQALKDVLAERRTPKNESHAGLVFITHEGQTWDKHKTTITHEMKKLMDKLKIGQQRKGLGMYTLRHVFRTVAGAAKDPETADFVMGHAKASMAARYIEGFEDERLKAVSDYVRAWLYPPAKEQPKAEEKPRLRLVGA